MKKATFIFIISLILIDFACAYGIGLFTSGNEDLKNGQMTLSLGLKVSIDQEGEYCIGYVFTNETNHTLGGCRVVDLQIGLNEYNLLLFRKTLNEEGGEIILKELAIVNLSDSTEVFSKTELNQKITYGPLFNYVILNEIENKKKEFIQPEQERTNKDEKEIKEKSIEIKTTEKVLEEDKTPEIIYLNSKETKKPIKEERFFSTIINFLKKLI